MDKREGRCRSPGRGGHRHRGHHSPGRGGHRGCGHGPGHHHGHHSPSHHGHGSGSGSGSGSHSPSPEPGSGSHGQIGHGPVVSDHKIPYFPPTLDIYRSWNGQFNDHFYTMDLTEHFTAVQHLGYANEGIVGRVLVDPESIPPCPRLKPLYRLWNGDIRDHFYTVNEEERENAISHLGYKDEGKLGYCVIPAGPTTNPTPESKEDCCDAKKALYRFYNETTKDHFYTTSVKEREHVISTLHDYKYEGIQCHLW